MLSNLKSKLFKSIQSKKLNVFGFFLLLSFMFLMFAKLSKNYTEIIPFQVTYENVPDQHSIVQKHDSVIYVKVKAYGFNLFTHNFFKHIVTVDFNKEVRKHGKEYIWDTKNGFSKVNAQLGSKIDILSIEPDSLSFPYEIMNVKAVPVKLESQIDFAPGYDMGDSLKILPDSVKIIGPKNMVEKISKIRTTKLILKNVNTSIDKEVNLSLDKSFNDKLRLSNDKVRVQGIVEKFTEGTFEVPVNIINLPSNIKINYFPKTILVSYYVSLENYKKVKALDFKIVCDYAEIKNQEGTFFIPKLVAKPNFVKSAKMKQNKVEFIIIE